jgi:hypothetical protein
LSAKAAEPFQPVSAVKVRPVGSALAHFDPANRPLALTTQVLLGLLAQVLEQMETVGDLSGLGCACSGAFSVEPMAIPGDDFYPRMLAQPRRQRGGGAIRRHVGDGCGLQIHEEGSPRGASAPGQLINANNPRVPTSGFSLCPTLEMPENRIVAHHDTKPGEQLARGFASSAVAHHRHDFGDGVALLRAANGETG